MCSLLAALKLYDPISLNECMTLRSMTNQETKRSSQFVIERCVDEIKYPVVTAKTTVNVIDNADQRYISLFVLPLLHPICHGCLTH